MKQKTAIVVMDMQKRMLFDRRGNSEVRDLDRQINAIQEVVAYGLENNIPRYLLEKKEGDMRGNETIPQISKLEFNERMLRVFPNAFLSAQFNNVMRLAEIQRIILAGVYDGVCVYVSTQEARVRNIQVTTSGDLINGLNQGRDYTQFYKDNTQFYNDHKDLIAALERERLAA